MNLFWILAESTTGPAGAGWGLILFYVVLFGGVMYFLIYRPQKKQQRQQDELMNSLEIGDSVCTTSGFYGVMIDKVDENVVIVEFGNNKNCRIPMKKTAIIEVEKPYDASKATAAAAEAASAEVEKKGMKKLLKKKDEE